MPGDTRPHVARAAKKRRRTRKKPGTVDAARRVLWAAMERVEEVLHEAAEPEGGRPVNPVMILKCAHALTQACGAYARIVEAGELEARLSELEAAVEAQNQADPSHRSSTHALGRAA
jgi:hypothetical protein